MPSNFDGPTCERCSIEPAATCECPVVGEGFDGIRDVSEALGSEAGAMVAEYLGRSAAERERLYEDLYKSAREDLRKMTRRALIAEARNDAFYRNLAAMGDIHRSAEDYIETKIEKEFDDLEPERF